MSTIGILNGPNLDRLGRREPEIYGTATLADLETRLRKEADALGVKVDFFQSNCEGTLIDTIVKWSDAGYAGIVFNPGAYSHTSIALHDAVAGVPIPVIEVHISNIYRRETFRHHSRTASACCGIISGLGFAGYALALRALVEKQ